MIPRNPPGLALREVAPEGDGNDPLRAAVEIDEVQIGVGRSMA